MYSSDKSDKRDKNLTYPVKREKKNASSRSKLLKDLLSCSEAHSYVCRDGFIYLFIFFGTNRRLIWKRIGNISGLYLSPFTSVDRLQQPRGTLSCGGEAQRWVRGGHLITRIERIEWIVVAVAACSAFRMTASITGRYHATCSFSPFPAPLFLFLLLSLALVPLSPCPITPSRSLRKF